MAPSCPPRPAAAANPGLDAGAAALRMLRSARPAGVGTGEWAACRPRVPGGVGGQGLRTLAPWHPGTSARPPRAAARRSRWATAPRGGPTWVGGRGPGVGVRGAWHPTTLGRGRAVGAQAARGTQAARGPEAGRGGAPGPAAPQPRCRRLGAAGAGPGEGGGTRGARRAAGASRSSGPAGGAPRQAGGSWSPRVRSAAPAAALLPGPALPIARARLHGGGHGHVAGTVVAADAAAVRGHADVQPPAGLHRVAHHPGRPAGLRPLRLFPHRLQQPGESRLRQRLPSEDLPRDTALPPLGSLRLRPHPPSLRHHLLPLLHGRAVLHQQDLLHPVPGRRPRARPCQGHGQGQEEELTLSAIKLVLGSVIHVVPGLLCLCVRVTGACRCVWRAGHTACTHITHTHTHTHTHTPLHASLRGLFLPFAGCR